jgi:hypothetical protein
LDEKTLSGNAYKPLVYKYDSSWKESTDWLDNEVRDSGDRTGHATSIDGVSGGFHPEHYIQKLKKEKDNN